MTRVHDGTPGHRPRPVGRGARDPGLGTNVGGAGNRPKPQPPTQADRVREQPHRAGPRMGPKPVKPPAWVLQRQRIMQRAGLGIVVDGVWGKRSVDAWLHLLAVLKGGHAPQSGGHAVDPGGGMHRGRRLELRPGGPLNLPHVPWAMKGPSALPALAMPTRASFDPKPLRPGAAEIQRQRRRDEESQRLARRNPTLAAALYPGRGETATGLRSVPWARPDISKALMPEDIMRLFDEDIDQKTGIFWKKVKRGGKNVFLPTKTGVAMVQGWARVRGFKTGFKGGIWDHVTNQLLEDIAKKARARERVRHTKQVKTALFDTGLARKAMVAAHIKPMDAKTFAAAIRGEGGTPWDVQVVFSQIAKLQQQDFQDAEFARWRDFVLANAGILNVSVMGQNGLNLKLPWDPLYEGSGVFAPPSVVAARNDFEFQIEFFKEAVTSASNKLAFDYANRLRKETGRPFYIEWYRPMPWEEGQAGPVLREEEQPDQNPPEGGGAWSWSRRFGSLEVFDFRDEASAGSAKVLDALGTPGTWMFEHVLGMSEYLTRNTLNAGQAVQVMGQEGTAFVRVRDYQDILTGEVIGTKPAAYLSASEAFEAGAVMYDELPIWLQVIGETAFDPFNLISGSWVSKPIAGLRRMRGGLKAEEGAVAVSEAMVRRQALYNAHWASRPSKVPGRLRRQFMTKRDALADIEARQTIQIRNGWKDAVLPPSLRKALMIGRDALRDLVLTAPGLVPLQRHARKAGASLYLGQERGQKSIFGTYVHARFSEAYRGVALAILRARHPELDIQSWDLGTYFTGAPRAELIAEQQELEANFRRFIDDEVLPFLQDIIEEETPLVWDETGTWVPTDDAAAFEGTLKELGEKVIADTTEVINPSYGKILDPQDYLSSREVQVHNHMARIRTYWEGRRPDLWIGTDDNAVAWRNYILTTEKAKIERELDRAYIGVHDESALEVIAEVERRTEQASREVRDYKVAIARSFQAQKELIDLAAEMNALSVIAGRPPLIELPGHSADALARAGMARAQAALNKAGPPRHPKVVTVVDTELPLRKAVDEAFERVGELRKAVDAAEPNSPAHEAAYAAWSKGVAEWGEARSALDDARKGARIGPDPQRVELEAELAQAQKRMDDLEAEVDESRGEDREAAWQAFEQAEQAWKALRSQLDDLPHRPERAAPAERYTTGVEAMAGTPEDEIVLQALERMDVLSQAWQEASSGLGHVDWEQLKAAAGYRARSVARTVKVDSEKLEVTAGSVLTRREQRRMIERALEGFFEADLQQVGLARSDRARQRLEDLLDARIQRLLGGGPSRQRVVRALATVMVESDEVVQLRFVAEDLETQVKETALLRDELMYTEAAYEDIAATVSDLEDLLKRLQVAREQFFTAMWRAAPPDKLEEVLVEIQAQRDELVEMRAAKDRGGPDQPQATTIEIDTMDRVLQMRARRIELLMDSADERRAYAAEQQLKGAKWSMERTYKQQGFAVRDLERGLTRAERQRDHYNNLDVGELLGGAAGDVDGFLDLRPTLATPRAYTRHQQEPFDVIRDISDEADAFAYMSQDPDFLALPELTEEVTVADIRKNVARRRPRALVEAMVQTNTPDVKRHGPEPAGEGPWAWGSPTQRWLVDKEGTTELEGQIGTERQVMRTDDFRKLRGGARVASERKRTSYLWRERRLLNKRAADQYRAAELKRKGLFGVAMKYSDWSAVRATYWAWRAHLQVWKTAVLPLRTAWTVVNYLDNTVKMLIKGVRDPRLWINPSGKHFPEWAPLSVIRYLIQALDARHGTHALRYYDDLVEGFWAQHSGILAQIFGSHGVPFPKELHDSFTASIRVAGDDAGQGRDLSWAEAQERHEVLDSEANALEQRAKRLRQHDPFAAFDMKTRARKLRREQRGLQIRAFRNLIWQITAGAGETWARRATYKSRYEHHLWTVRKDFPVMAEDRVQGFAVMRAMKDVNHMLFDPGDLTVFEDNFSALFPFINFVKSNTKFWANVAWEDPWVLSGLDRWDDHQEANGDPYAPSWMQRFTEIPYLGGLPLIGTLQGVLFTDGYFDPRNLTSFGKLYRAFKEPNDLLTPEQGGIEILNQIVGSTEDVGLGWSPFVKKGLEMGGLVQVEFWRDIFPQTTMVQALDVDYLNKRWPDGINLEAMFLDPVYKAMTGKSLTDLRIEDFNRLVAREVAGSRLRGEPTLGSEERAREKITDYILAQQVFAYGMGVFVRRVTREDAWFSWAGQQMAMEMEGRPGVSYYDGVGAQPAGKPNFYYGMTDKQKGAYQIMKAGRGEKVGEEIVMKWEELRPKVQLYYQLDGKEADAFLAAHPEIVNHVGTTSRETLIGGRTVPYQDLIDLRRGRRKRDSILAGQTEAFYNLKDAIQGGDDTIREVQDELEQLLVTKELKIFWERNDTPGDVRRAMLALEYKRVVDVLMKRFFKIPQADWKARGIFLEQNPILPEYWRQGGVRLENGLPTPDAQADDLLDLVQLHRSHMRDYYGALIDVGGYDVAEKFLRMHSDMFIGTKAEDNVSEVGYNAFWVPGGVNSAQGKMYIRIKPWLDAYFDHPKGSEARRQVGREHPEVYEYFDLYANKGKRYGKGDKRFSQHQADYLAVKSLLDAYFALPKSQRYGYAAAHPEILAYFKKYSKSHARSRRGRRWVNFRALRDQYWALPEGEREAFLKAHPDLRVDELDVDDAHRKMGASRLGIARRAEFWMIFYSLMPDKRAAFVRAQAANYGVFVYGILGAEQAHDDRQHALVQRFMNGEMTRQQAYLFAKPLLDIFFALKEEEQALFLDANPELQVYFRHYTKKKSLTGNPATDKAIEQFFNLGDDPLKKQAFLDEHPEVEKYFHSRQTPEERALGRLIDQYFALPKEHRDDYLQRHPEVEAFFDLREAQRDMDDDLREAFDESDPRIQALLMRQWDIQWYAEMVQTKLEQAGEKPMALERRRDRRDERETREQRSTI